MATILDNQRSDYGSPYVYYTVRASEIQDSRTADEVQIYVEIDTRLASSSSRLGTGKALRSRIYFFDGDNDYDSTDLPTQYFDIDIKSSGDDWSGTTTHTQTKEITLTNLPASLTTIKNIQFRVWRTDGSGDSGHLSARACDDLTISIGHLVPSNVQYTMVETNPLLTNAGVSDDILVENLSQKRLTFTYELHDEATMERVGVYNNIKPYSSTSNPFVLDLSTITLEKNPNDNTKIPLRPYVKDSFSTQGLGLEVNYSYIAYTPILLTETLTTVRRNGQTSGKVRLNVNGTFFNGTIGNINQSSYKPTIKYKYWLATDSEPSTYITIPSNSISVSNNEFSVTNYEIGSSTETDVNFFNPNNVYRVKVYVEDNFTSKESKELSIPKGYSIWDEYADRVNFRKITIQQYDPFDYDNETIVGYYNSKPIYRTILHSTRTISGGSSGTVGYLDNPTQIMSLTGAVKITGGNWLSLPAAHNGAFNWQVGMYYNNSDKSITVETGSGRTVTETYVVCLYFKN